MKTKKNEKMSINLKGGGSFESEGKVKSGIIIKGKGKSAGTGNEEEKNEFISSTEGHNEHTVTNMDLKRRTRTRASVINGGSTVSCVDSDLKNSDEENDKHRVKGNKGTFSKKTEKNLESSSVEQSHEEDADVRETEDDEKENSNKDTEWYNEKMNGKGKKEKYQNGTIGYENPKAEETYQEKTETGALEGKTKVLKKKNVNENDERKSSGEEDVTKERSDELMNGDTKYDQVPNGMKSQKKNSKNTFHEKNEEHEDDINNISSRKRGASSKLSKLKRGRPSISLKDEATDEKEEHQREEEKTKQKENDYEEKEKHKREDMYEEKDEYSTRKRVRKGVSGRELRSAHKENEKNNNEIGFEINSRRRNLRSRYGRGVEIEKVEKIEEVGTRKSKRHAKVDKVAELEKKNDSFTEGEEEDESVTLEEGGNDETNKCNKASSVVSSDLNKEEEKEKSDDDDGDTCAGIEKEDNKKMETLMKKEKIDDEETKRQEQLRNQERREAYIKQMKIPKYADDETVSFYNNPHYFLILLFLTIFKDVIKLEWNFNDVYDMFQKKETTEFCKKFVLKLSTFVGKYTNARTFFMYKCLSRIFEDKRSIFLRVVNFDELFPSVMVNTVSTKESSPSTANKVKKKEKRKTNSGSRGEESDDAELDAYDEGDAEEEEEEEEGDLEGEIEGETKEEPDEKEEREIKNESEVKQELEAKLELETKVELKTKEEQESTKEGNRELEEGKEEKEEQDGIAAKTTIMDEEELDHCEKTNSGEVDKTKTETSEKEFNLEGDAETDVSGSTLKKKGVNQVKQEEENENESLHNELKEEKTEAVDGSFTNKFFFEWENFSVVHKLRIVRMLLNLVLCEGNNLRRYSKENNLNLHDGFLGKDENNKYWFIYNDTSDIEFKLYIEKEEEGTFEMVCDEDESLYDIGQSLLKKEETEELGEIILQKYNKICREKRSRKRTLKQQQRLFGDMNVNDVFLTNRRRQVKQVNILTYDGKRETGRGGILTNSMETNNPYSLQKSTYQKTDRSFRLAARNAMKGDLSDLQKGGILNVDLVRGSNADISRLASTINGANNTNTPILNYFGAKLLGMNGPNSLNNLSNMNNMRGLANMGSMGALNNMTNFNTVDMNTLTNSNHMNNLGHFTQLGNYGGFRGIHGFNSNLNTMSGFTNLNNVGVNSNFMRTANVTSGGLQLNLKDSSNMSNTDNNTAETSTANVESTNGDTYYSSRTSSKRGRKKKSEKKKRGRKRKVHYDENGEVIPPPETTNVQKNNNNNNNNNNINNNNNNAIKKNTVAVENRMSTRSSRRNEEKPFAIKYATRSSAAMNDMNMAVKTGGSTLLPNVANSQYLRNPQTNMTDANIYNNVNMMNHPMNSAYNLQNNIFNMRNSILNGGCNNIPYVYNSNTMYNPYGGMFNGHMFMYNNVGNNVNNNANSNVANNNVMNVNNLKLLKNELLLRSQAGMESSQLGGGMNLSNFNNMSNMNMLLMQSANMSNANMCRRGNISSNVNNNVNSNVNSSVNGIINNNVNSNINNNVNSNINNNANSNINSNINGNTNGTDMNNGETNVNKGINNDNVSNNESPVDDNSDNTNNNANSNTNNNTNNNTDNDTSAPSGNMRMSHHSGGTLNMHTMGMGNNLDNMNSLFTKYNSLLMNRHNVNLPGQLYNNFGNFKYHGFGNNDLMNYNYNMQNYMNNDYDKMNKDMFNRRAMMIANPFGLVGSSLQNSGSITGIGNINMRNIMNNTSSMNSINFNSHVMNNCMNNNSMGNSNVNNTNVNNTNVHNTNMDNTNMDNTNMDNINVNNTDVDNTNRDNTNVNANVTNSSNINKSNNNNSGNNDGLAFDNSNHYNENFLGRNAAGGNIESNTNRPYGYYKNAVTAENQDGVPMNNEDKLVSETYNRIGESSNNTGITFRDNTLSGSAYSASLEAQRVEGEIEQKLENHSQDVNTSSGDGLYNANSTDGNVDSSIPAEFGTSVQMTNSLNENVHSEKLQSEGTTQYNNVTVGLNPEENGTHDDPSRKDTVPDEKLESNNIAQDN